MATADGIAGIGAPSTSTRLLEAVWPVEAAPFAALSPMLRRLGRGDRHPVLILPGFSTSDRPHRFRAAWACPVL